MARGILILVVIALVSKISAEENSNESVKNLKVMEAHADLVKALFENYNPEIIPSPVNVKFGAALLTTKFVAEESVLDSNMWLRMVWSDPRLRWNESDFGGIAVLRLDPSRVWIPDIQLYNAADSSSGTLSTSCAQTKVLIYPNGEVLWVPPCRYLSRCKNTLRKFPNSPQTCMLKFASWTYDGFHIGMKMYNDKNYLDMSDYDDITDWKVISQVGGVNTKYYSCCTEPYIDVTYNVTIQRKTEQDYSTPLDYSQWKD